MNLIIYLSNMLIPLVIFCFVGTGILNKRNVYEDFVNGAKDGMKTVVTVMPTLIGLMIGISVLGSSGFMGFLVGLLKGVSGKTGIPGVVMPAVIVRIFSSSAATGLVLDVFKKFGPDSYEGILSGIMMSSTETIFYTMSVYFMAAKVKNTGWTVRGAFFSTLAGLVASVILAGMIA